MDLIYRADAINAANDAADDWDGGPNKGREEIIRNGINAIPSVPAVPLDKLCELCEGAGARVPCVICSKIMPEWCKKNNNLPLSWDEEWKCPSWKQFLTKWMEEQDAVDRR